MDRNIQLNLAVFRPYRQKLSVIIRYFPSAKICLFKFSPTIDLAPFSMKLVVQVCLGPGHIVLDGDPDPPQKRDTASNFRPMSIVAKRSPISATAELLCKFSVNSYFQKKTV